MLFLYKFSLFILIYSFLCDKFTHGLKKHPGECTEDQHTVFFTQKDNMKKGAAGFHVSFVLDAALMRHLNLLCCGFDPLEKRCAES